MNSSKLLYRYRFTLISAICISFLIATVAGQQIARMNLDLHAIKDLFKKPDKSGTAVAVDRSESTTIQRENDAVEYPARLMLLLKKDFGSGSPGTLHAAMEETDFYGSRFVKCPADCPDSGHQSTFGIPEISLNASIKFYKGRLSAARHLYRSSDLYRITTFSRSDTPIKIAHSYRGISPMVSLRAFDIVSFGIGPSVHRVESKTIHPDLHWKSEETKFGTVIDIALNLPFPSPFYLRVKLQIRLLGELEIDPEDAGLDNRITVDRANSINFNHARLAFKMGIRI